MSGNHNYFNHNFIGKKEPDISINDNTMTNLNDELFGDSRDGLFLESDIFGNKSSNDLDVEVNLLDYLKEHKYQVKKAEDPVMQNVRQMYTQLNQHLERNGMPVMGDLWKIDAFEIQKILNIITELIKKRGQDVGSKISNTEGNL